MILHFFDANTALIKHITQKTILKFGSADALKFLFRKINSFVVGKI